ncbi:MAG TPA: hypothetical protein VL500_06420 [Candidatus Eisenbacteria bacterium]|nr:hypothetical protein [Candidatus Eisenbacteria bacterium]
MRKRYAFGAALVSLLLVGAGCGATQDTSGQVQLPPRQEGKMEAKTEVKTDGSVDATVDGILEDGDDEQELLQGANSDAAELDTDKAELKAYSDSDYEVK